MIGEIDKDFYCDNFSIAAIGECFCHRFLRDNPNCSTCSAKHRKYPTPEQFKEEYGEEWKGGYYVALKISYALGKVYSWSEVFSYEIEKYDDYAFDIVCACTPWGEPPDGWRP